VSLPVANLYVVCGAAFSQSA